MQLLLKFPKENTSYLKQKLAPADQPSADPTPDAELTNAGIKPATEQEVEEKDSDFCLKNINVITECSYIGLSLKDVTQNLPIYSFLIYSFLVHCDFFKFSAINHLVFASLNYAPLF